MIYTDHLIIVQEEKRQFMDLYNHMQKKNEKINLANNAFCK